MLLATASFAQTLPKIFSQAELIHTDQREGKGYLQFGMKHSDTEDDILSLYQDRYPDMGFYKVIITSKRYYYERDSDYKVKYRLLDVDLLSKVGSQCRAYDVSVRQEKIYKDYGVYEHHKISGYYPIECVE